MNCQSCYLFKTGCGKYVEGRGNPKAPIVIVGDLPSRKDRDHGVVFSGEEGLLLDRALKAVGMTRATVFTTRMLKCAPDFTDQKKGGLLDYGEAEAEAYTKCMTWLDREISYVAPKVIVVLGETAVRHFTGRKTVASVQDKVWDSSEVPLLFTYSKVATGSFDLETETTVEANKEAAFKLLGTHSLRDAVNSPHRYQDLVRTLTMAQDISDGKSVFGLPHEYHYAHSEEEVYAMLQMLLERADTETRMVFDYETSGLNWFKRMHHPHVAKVLTCSVCFKEREAFGFVLRPKSRSQRVIAAFQQLMRHPIKKCGHNVKFDVLFSRADLGVDPANIDFDTMISAYALNPVDLKGLDHVAPPYRPDLGRWWEVAERHLDKAVGYLNAPDDVLLKYNCMDVDATMTVWLNHEIELEKREKMALFRQLLMPHSEVATDEEWIGLGTNVEAAKNLGRSLLKNLNTLEETTLAKLGRHPHWWSEFELQARGIPAKDFKPLNLGSSPQLSDYLYRELNLKSVKQTEAGKASTDEEALKALEDQFPDIKAILEYRELSKFLGTYIGWEAKPIQRGTTGDLFAPADWEPEGVNSKKASLLSWVGEDSRLHANFNVVGTVTGRISITKPALQTFPKTSDIRQLFVPAPGYNFVDADFKALELRILAILSGDPEFIRIFREGIDPHSVTASKMFDIPLDPPAGAPKDEMDAYFADWAKKHKEERRRAKTVNFGIPYGSGPDGLAAQLGATKAEAQKWLDDWSTKVFPVAARWLEDQVRFAEKHGFIRYSMNREVPLYGIRSTNRSQAGEAQRASKNYPIQGTGSDCCTMSLVRIQKRLKTEFGLDNARVVVEIHDAIVTEQKVELAERVKAIVVEEMTRQMPFLPPVLPLEVDAAIKNSLD